MVCDHLNHTARQRHKDMDYPVSPCNHLFLRKGAIQRSIIPKSAPIFSQFLPYSTTRFQECIKRAIQVAKLTIDSLKAIFSAREPEVNKVSHHVTSGRNYYGDDKRNSSTKLHPTDISSARASSPYFAQCDHITPGLSRCYHMGEQVTMPNGSPF